MTLRRKPNEAAWGNLAVYMWSMWSVLTCFMPSRVYGESGLVCVGGAAGVGSSFRRAHA